MRETTAQPCAPARVFCYNFAMSAIDVPSPAFDIDEFRQELRAGKSLLTRAILRLYRLPRWFLVVGAVLLLTLPFLMLLVHGDLGSVLATDLAPSMVEGLRGSASALPWLTVEVGDAEQPPDGAFDVVQAGLVLFFLPSLDTALARYREVLTADGRLGFTWFGQPDARWGPVFGALAADLPEHERPNRAAEDGPFGSVPAMHEHLTALGWTDVTTEKLVLEVQVRDADHWFEWSWSQGYRTVLEKLESRDLLAAARERVRRLLEEMAARDGALTWRAEVQATLAHPS